MAMSAEGTGRQRVEEALSESQERFQAIFSQAAVGIAQIGLDKEWLLVNNRFCQMLGYSEAELRRKTLNDITHPDDNEESLAGRAKSETAPPCADHSCRSARIGSARIARRAGT